MAVYSRADAVAAAKVFVPTQQYRVCVIKTEKKLGNKPPHYPQIKLTLEIVEPEQVEHEGRAVKVAGQTFNIYLVLENSLIGAQKNSCFDAVWAFCDKVGLTPMFKRDENGSPLFDDENHKEYFLGLEFNMILSSKDRIKRMRQTEEQKANGEPGTPLIDGATGQPITDGWQIVGDMQEVDYNCNPSRREVAF